MMSVWTLFYAEFFHKSWLFKPGLVTAIESYYQAGFILYECLVNLLLLFFKYLMEEHFTEAGRKWLVGRLVKVTLGRCLLDCRYWGSLASLRRWKWLALGYTDISSGFRHLFGYLRSLRPSYISFCWSRFTCCTHFVHIYQLYLL